MDQWGYAAVQIIPSLKGVQATMDRELSGMLPGVGTRAGERLGSSTRSGFKRALGDLSGIAANAVAATTTSLVAAGAAATTYGIRLAAANETATIGFETTLGSASRAERFLTHLADFAADTPFDLPSLRTAASRLTAVGTEAGRVIPIMETLGDATSGMGTGAEGIEQSVRALTQMEQKGKVSAEEVLQLAEAGIPAWDALAAQMGVTVAEAQKAVSTGSVAASVMFDALENKAGPALGRLTGLMDEQAQTLTGLWSTYQDEAGQRLATAFGPTVDELKDMLPVLTDVSGELIDRFAPGLAAVAGEAGDFLPDLVDGLHTGLDLLEQYGPAAASLGGTLLGLGKSSIPFVGQFIPGGPLALGLAGLIATSPKARDAVADIGSEVGPVAAQFADELLPILGDLQDIAADVLPPAIGLTGDALRLLFEAGTPVARLVGDLTGLLADHTEIVYGLAVAYGIVKFDQWVSGIDLASNGVYLLASNTNYLRTSIVDLAAARGISTTAAGLGVLASSLPNITLMASGTKQLASNLLAVPEANARLSAGAAEGLSKIKAGFGNVANSSVSAGTAATGALAGIAIGAAAATYALDKLHQSGKRDAETFLAGLDKVDNTRFQSIIDNTAELNDEIQRLYSEQDKGSTNRFDDEKLAAQIAALEDRAAKANEVRSQVSRGIVDFTKQTGITSKQVEALAKAAGVELPEAFDESGKATPQLMAKWEELQDAAKVTGATMDEALALDPAVLAANVKVIEAAQQAVASAYSGFGDILQITDNPVDPKAVQSAREAVADAEKRLRDLDAEATVDQVDQARSDLEDARQALSDLLATDSPLNHDKIATFYRDVIADTEDFSADVQAALEAGYDPAFVSRLLQAGPEQAGPILDQLTTDVDQAFVDMVNNAEGALSDLSGYAVEAARLQQIAITTAGADGQRMSTELADAIVISQEMQRTHGETTLAELARVAGITEEQVRQVAADFGLSLDAIDGREIAIYVRGVLGDELTALGSSVLSGTAGRAVNEKTRVKGPQPPKGPERAIGGRVLPGVIYPINEKGLEGFMPDVPGTVITADQMAGRAGTSGRGRRRRGSRDELLQHEVTHRFAGRELTRSLGGELIFAASD